MAHSFKLGAVAVVLAAITAGAQIIELREAGGKTISCMHSGLMSDLKDCGFRSDWYAYVFVGSISAIKPASNDEEILQITPEEVFSGNPSASLTVLTSQGACLPTFAVGDRWLFYLRKEKGKPIVLDYCGNDSRPIDSAQNEIETLRELKTIGEFGIVRGSVQRRLKDDVKGVPGAQVLATRKLDGVRFYAATDVNGHFEFAPLTPGEYKLTVDPIASFRPDDSGVKVKSGSCWDVTMSRSPHAEISGHLKHPDGSPAEAVPVRIINADGSGYNTLKSDSHGYFHSDEMTSGKYLVAINPPGAPAWEISGCGGVCQFPAGALYYPWLHDRSDALVIDLSEDEKRNNIDFTIPKWPNFPPY